MVLKKGGRWDGMVHVWSCTSSCALQ
jgi:hypothetical protein